MYSVAVVEQNIRVCPKIRPQSGGRGLSSADIFRTSGVLQMRTSALFGAKTLDFLKIFILSARTREVEPVQTFFGKGGKGSIFRNFMQTSFMDSSLQKQT